jgi:hypothetical protein
MIHKIHSQALGVDARHHLHFVRAVILEKNGTVYYNVRLAGRR